MSIECCCLGLDCGVGFHQDTVGTGRLCGLDNCCFSRCAEVMIWFVHYRESIVFVSRRRFYIMEILNQGPDESRRRILFFLLCLEDLQITFLAACA